MISQPRAVSAGVTLRHWTVDRLAFVGGREKPSPESSGVELANGRILRLVASRLKGLKPLPVCQTA